jgi:hypothetical protein
MTLDEARARLAKLRPRIERFLVLRADLAELRADLAEHGFSGRGGLADAKGMEARLYAELEALSTDGWQVRATRRCCSICRGSATAYPCSGAGWRATPTSVGTTVSIPASRVAVRPDLACGDINISRV